MPDPIETAAPVINGATADAPFDAGTAVGEDTADETASLPPPEEMETATKIEEPAGVPVDTYAQKPKPEEPPDLLQSIISSIYANEVIIKDYIFKTLPLNYYLPDRKTAILSKRPAQNQIARASPEKGGHHRLRNYSRRVSQHLPAFPQTPPFLSSADKHRRCCFIISSSA